MYRAIIIDDEPHGISCLRLLIERYITDLKVVAVTTEGMLGIELIENYKPEIVFLDINMPHLNGFELLEKLNYKDFNLIFTTAHHEYAVKAIKNNALDYLLKPIDIDDLEKTMSVIRERSNQQQQIKSLENLFSELHLQQDNKIPLHTKEKVEFVQKNEILRMECDTERTNVFLTNGQKITASKTISEYESLLCNSENKFMRVHQSHIVNLNHVTKYTKEGGGIIITKDNHEIPLSKTKREVFTKWLNIK